MIKIIHFFDIAITYCIHGLHISSYAPQSVIHTLTHLCGFIDTNIDQTCPLNANYGIN